VLRLIEIVNCVDTWQVKVLPAAPPHTAPSHHTLGIASGIGTPWIYTSPATMSMSSSSVTFTLISPADPTKSRHRNHL
jgi:hypothetical protein